MQIRRYHDVSKFRNAVLPFLLHREAEHCMLIGVLTTVSQRVQQGGWMPLDSAYFAAVFEEDEVIAVAFFISPRDLILSYAGHFGALNLIAQDMAHTFDDLPGIVATKAIARGFAEIWSAIKKQPYTVTMSQRIFQLEKVNPVSGVSGHWGYATEAHLELLIDWMDAFSTEALGYKDRDMARKSVQYRLHSQGAESLYLWFDPHPVAMAGTSGPTPNGIRINAVYTPPEHRKHGYASALTASVSQKMLDNGLRYCFLYTDIDNPTSNRIYQAIGYSPVCDADVIKFSHDEAT